MINSQAYTEKRIPESKQELNQLRKDLRTLKEMLRNEKLKNSDLRVQLDKLRLAREIESPSYQLAQLKFAMEREQLKL